MAKLLQLSDEHFQRFSREDCSKIKRVIYRRDFQEEIIALRKKHNVRTFPKIKGATLNEWARGVPSKIRKTLDRDARLACHKLNLDVGLWLPFIFILVFYDYIIPVGRAQKLHVPSETEIEKQKQRYDMREHVMPDDVTSAYSEIELYDSDTLHAQTKNGEIVLRISPQSSMTEVRSVFPALKKCIKFLREQEHGKERHDLLDVFNDVLNWQREGNLSVRAIFNRLKDQYADQLAGFISEAEARPAAARRYRGEEYVRTMLKRAKELGF